MTVSGLLQTIAAAASALSRRNRRSPLLCLKDQEKRASARTASAALQMVTCRPARSVP
jgi:hypothetical protein